MNNIIRWAIKKHITVIMLMVGIIILGSVSIFKLSIDLLPKINVPVAVISTQYPGAGPHEIENLITRPIEEAVATVQNIKRINSTSSEGTSIVVVEFNQDTDMDFATLEMREKVDLIKDFLPNDAHTPMILKIDPNALPIMTLGMGGDADLSQLQEMAEKRIKPRLERLEGVASVSISGGYKEQVEILVDPSLLQSYGITVDQLAGIIKAENINLPAGEVYDGNNKKLFRTLGEFETIDELRELPIPLPTGTTIPLKELATVNITTGEIEEVAKMDGEESIRITIQKQSIANTVKVANLVNEEINNLNKEIDDIEIKPIIDQSIYIKNAITNVGKTAIYGGILAIIVLYLFLRNYRTTIIIALAIPISVMATLGLMYFFNMTINLLSLGGFALGVGMLVDNGIVVTENIHRYREEGYTAKKASLIGTEEVAMAVTASTLTTIAVFLPMVFVEGMTAEIFRELALTVTFALLASLLTSLTLVPMMSSRILEKELPVAGEKNLVYKGVDKAMEITHYYYRSILNKSIHNRPLVIVVTIIIFLVSIAGLMQTGAEYFPAFDEGTFTIDVLLPHGSTLEQTEIIVTTIEKIVGDHEAVDTLFTNIGGGSGFYYSHNRRSNRASIDGKLVPQNKRQKKTVEVVDEIREDLKVIAGAKINITSTSSIMAMGLGGGNLELEIRGDNLETLNIIATDFIEMIEAVDGTREVQSNYVEAPPQIGMKINRHATSQYGLQAIHVASITRTVLQGSTVSKFKIDGQELDVVIKGEPYLQDSISNFMQMMIHTPLGVSVPLEALVTLEQMKGPTSIRRVDQQRAVTISADIINRDLHTVIADIEEEISRYPLPTGYVYRFRGEYEQLQEAFISLILVVILAILLVYMILAAQFQSLLYPFIIMFSVPMAFSGGAIGLVATKRPLSVPAMIGGIVLAGIVVNNGIVLIDYINNLRDKGNTREDAIITAGYTRLRPILMTTFTTILGLLPLAIGLGEGAEAQAPMATVVIGGLLMATFLTLVVTPVIYSLFDDLKIRFHF